MNHNLGDQVQYVVVSSIIRTTSRDKDRQVYSVIKFKYFISIQTSIFPLMVIKLVKYLVWWIF